MLEIQKYLRSGKTLDDLKEEFAAGIKVLEPDCSDWSAMIENNQINNQINNQKIVDEIEAVCHAGADVIVLGCTHYHWIEELIKTIVNGRAEVIQPESATVEQLKQVIARLG